MVSQTVIVKNKIGIHSRPAALLVETAEKYESSVTLTNGERSATTASMTKLLALRAKVTNAITVTADGPDESEALKAIVSLIDSGFGED
jgi:phosphotransferase system HPr (HPr) family protein